MSNPQSKIKGGSLRSPAPKTDQRPTPDQMFLAERLNGAAKDVGGAETNSAGKNRNGRPPLPGSLHLITPAALQKWNLVYGVAAVSDALRTAWGFPPLAGIDNPYAYVQQILRGGTK